MRCGVYVRVSTDDQKDNGYSIDSQLRMIKEYCEKKNYDIIDVYNDAGHSGKDLMRPEMQRLLKDIKSKKIDKLVAIKVDRLTRSNYDGFWLLNYLEEHDVKLELILEPFDVSTANGEMIYGMNLVFGQRERKEIGARTKRAMEEMALEHIHPSKAPYGYTRNKETGQLEVEPIEAQVVKEIFDLYKNGYSTRGIATKLKDDNAYLKQGKWRSDRVYKILTNSIYIGIFEYGKRHDDIHIENMVRLCLEHMDLVNQFFENQKSYYIEDVTHEIPSTSPIYATFMQQKIHSIIVVPFMDNKKIKGVFAVDNPKQNYYQKDFLESLCFFIKTAMEREKEKTKLKNLSYVDSLTYAQNRNHFNEYIEQNRNKELHSLGVIYLDLNGLKEINDKMGHIAGDTLIITASYALQEIFLDNSYRVGGDEFVVIEQDVSELLFFDQYAKLLKRMKELEISVAAGCVWKETCSNLSETLQEADQKMYEDKKRYYSLAENDRRSR